MSAAWRALGARPWSVPRRRLFRVHASRVSALRCALGARPGAVPRCRPYLVRASHCHDSPASAGYHAASWRTRSDGGCNCSGSSSCIGCSRGGSSRVGGNGSESTTVRRARSGRSRGYRDGASAYTSGAGCGMAETAGGVSSGSDGRSRGRRNGILDPRGVFRAPAAYGYFRISFRPPHAAPGNQPARLQ